MLERQLQISSTMEIESQYPPPSLGAALFIPKRQKIASSITGSWQVQYSVFSQQALKN